MDKKRITGAKTSQKIAALLSIGILALPLAGFTSKLLHNEHAENIQVEEEKKVQNLQSNNSYLFDTSYINAQNFYDGYVESFEDGNQSYIIEQMEQLKETYEMLRITPGTYVATENGVTFNFDGSPIEYDELKDGIFYKDNSAIKEIHPNSVMLKTKNGKITFSLKPDKSLTINNHNELADVTTKIVYSADKSCSISEESVDRQVEYIFDENGLIYFSSDTKDTLNPLYYENGDIRKSSSGNIQKEINSDGSYTITKDDCFIKPAGSDVSVQLPQTCSVTYYYNSNDTFLRAVVSTDDNHSKSIRCNVNSDGTYELAVKEQDKNGNVIYSELKERDKNNIFKHLLKELDENGTQHTTVETIDYNLISPDYVFSKPSKQIKGDTTYLKIDDVEYIKQKDGFIYKYNRENGNFYQAYQVDGTSEVKYANEEGKIIMVKDRTKETNYIDYENHIKSSVRNISQSPITIEYNGESYVLNPNKYIQGNAESIITYQKDDKTTLQFFADGSKHVLHTLPNGDAFKIEYYDSDNKITSVFQDGILTSYYDYENNIIKSISDNKGIQKNYYENTQTLSSISNSSKEEIYYDGFELKKGSMLNLYEDGSVKKYYYDNSSYYQKDENGNYVGNRKENNTLYEYKKDGQIEAITTNVDDPDMKEKTFYYNYEEGLISSITNKDQRISYYYDVNPDTNEQYVRSIENYSEDSRTVYDKDGNEYILEKDDEITYWENGGIHYLKQGSQQFNYCVRNNTELYFIRTQDSISLYYNGSVLYQSDDPHAAGYYISSVYEKDGKTYIQFGNGTLIEHEENEQNISENNEEVFDEER